MTGHSAAAFGLISVVLGASPATADIIAPLLPKGECEIGARWRNIDRTLYYETSTTEIDANDASVVVRYGLTSNATFAAEVMVGPGDIISEEKVERFYTVGASLRTLIWSKDALVVSSGIHYVNSYLRRQPTTCDRETQTIDWELLGEWSTTRGSHLLTVWAGPIVSHFSFTNQGPCEEDYWTPADMFGATLGVTAVFWHKLVVDGSFVWTENPEPRLGLAYRF